MLEHSILQVKHNRLLMLRYYLHLSGLVGSIRGHAASKFFKAGGKRCTRRDKESWDYWQRTMNHSTKNTFKTGEKNSFQTLQILPRMSTSFWAVGLSRGTSAQHLGWNEVRQPIKEHFNMPWNNTQGMSIKRSNFLFYCQQCAYTMPWNPQLGRQCWIPATYNAHTRSKQAEHLLNITFIMPWSAESAQYEWVTSTFIVNVYCTHSLHSHLSFSFQSQLLPFPPPFSSLSLSLLSTFSFNFSSFYYAFSLAE